MKKNHRSIFDFVVRYLGFLKKIPLLPHAFDASLRIIYLLFNRSVIEALNAIEETVSEWEQVEVTHHKYGGVQFNYKEKEIGHMHSNGLIDIPLNRKTKAELISQGLVTDHHIFKKSGWVSMYVKEKEDAQKAISVLKMSWLRCNGLEEEQ